MPTAPRGPLTAMVRIRQDHPPLDQLAIPPLHAPRATRAQQLKALVDEQAEKREMGSCWPTHSRDRDDVPKDKKLLPDSMW